jgi:hypothetical protein
MLITENLEPMSKLIGLGRLYRLPSQRSLRVKSESYHFFWNYDSIRANAELVLAHL